MRGEQRASEGLFSYIRLEERVPRRIIRFGRSASW